MAEGARLESVCAGYRTAGSNPARSGFWGTLAGCAIARPGKSHRLYHSLPRSAHRDLGPSPTLHVPFRLFQPLAPDHECGAQLDLQAINARRPRGGRGIHVCAPYLRPGNRFCRSLVPVKPGNG